MPRITAAFLLLFLGVLERPTTLAYRIHRVPITMVVADYAQTSASVKGVVGGLTTLTNALFSPDTAKVPPTRVRAKATVSPTDVLLGVVKDFENGYLFSGEIEAEIYADDCVFTDPTLSFTGLSTFERNIQALKPLLNVFVGDTLVVLYDATLNQNKRQVSTQWRMSGNVRLPWRPAIELTGNTVLTYDPTQDGGRIVSYFERWDVDAGTALRQLLRPAQRIPSAPFLPVIRAPGAAAINVQAVKRTLAASFGARQRGRAWQCEVRAALSAQVAQLVRAVPLETLQKIQAAGDAVAGRRQAVAAAWGRARARGRSWTLALASSAGAEVLGATGCRVRFAADGAACESECADGPLAVQIVRTSCAIDEDGAVQFVPTAREVRGVRWPGGPSPVGTVETAFHLGYFDDEWLVFVSQNGEYFVLTA